MSTTWARRWHALTSVVVVGSLVLQFVLVLQGGRVLDEATAPPLGERLYQFFAYFTVESNLLIAVGVILLAMRPDLDGAWFRWVRLAGLVGITVTAVVHFFLLRPLLDLDGADYLADKLLHMVVPAMAVAGWALFGPRPRITTRDSALALLYPLVWTAWSMLWGGVINGWYAYPFMDPGYEDQGWGVVAVALVGITVFFVAVFALYQWLDGRLRPAPGRMDP